MSVYFITTTATLAPVALLSQATTQQPLGRQAANAAPTSSSSGAIGDGGPSLASPPTSASTLASALAFSLAVGTAAGVAAAGVAAGVAAAA